MALESRPLDTTLQLLYDMGVDETRRRSYTNVKAEASDQDIWDVATTITDLQTQPVSKVQTIDRTDLVNV